jgi:hypothetical protein
MKKSLPSFFTAVFLCSILFQPGCRDFQQVKQSPDVLFSKSEISTSLNQYDVYVHGNNGVLKLENVRVSGDTLFDKCGIIPEAKKAIHHSQSVDIYSELVAGAIYGESADCKGSSAPEEKMISILHSGEK